MLVAEGKLDLNGAVNTARPEAEIYNVSTNAWTRVADSAFASANAQCFLLPDGSPLSFNGSMVRYDTASNTWGTRALPQRIDAGGLVMLPGGNLLYASLANPPELYVPGTNTWGDILGTASWTPRRYNFGAAIRRIPPTATVAVRVGERESPVILPSVSAWPATRAAMGAGSH